ncbi:unnamed protein product [Danaus chrysippus]|uniref:(African queen) hypothetical protein n=1 Tax=Danaus chrysippus TaxID=151541 RepID=A0A8J2QX06_9NEOP|nr:unnamed protein product [Danaus chrysippus]
MLVSGRLFSQVDDNQTQVPLALGPGSRRSSSPTSTTNPTSRVFTSGCHQKCIVFQEDSYSDDDSGTEEVSDAED